MTTRTSRRRFLQASSAFGGALCALAGRARAGLPVDAAIQPSLAGGPVIPESAYRRRASAVQAELQKRDMAALVVTSLQEYDTRYIAQHAPGVLVVPASGEPTLFAPGRPRTWLSDVRSAATLPAMLDQCAARLKDLRIERGRVALGGELEWAVTARLAASLPQMRFEPGNEIQDPLRLVKDEHEIAVLRRVQEISDAQIEAGQRAIAPGRRDWEVLADMARAGAARGAEINESRHLIGYGPGTDDLWVPMTGRRIQAGEVVNFEGIVYYGHYVVETPVTFAVGRVSAKQKALADVTFDAFQAGIAEIKPGRPLGRVVDASNAILKAHGYDKMIRRHGHFSGISNNDRPAFGDAIDAGLLLQPGMFMSYHTTIISPTREAIAVVGREVLVTKDGYEFLSKIKPTPMVPAGS